MSTTRAITKSINLSFSFFCIAGLLNCTGFNTTSHASMPATVPMPALRLLITSKNLPAFRKAQTTIANMEYERLQELRSLAGPIAYRADALSQASQETIDSDSWNYFKKSLRLYGHGAREALQTIDGAEQHPAGRDAYLTQMKCNSNEILSIIDTECKKYQ